MTNWQHLGQASPHKWSLKILPSNSKVWRVLIDEQWESQRLFILDWALSAKPLNSYLKLLRMIIVFTFVFVLSKNTLVIIIKFTHSSIFARCAWYPPVFLASKFFLNQWINDFKHGWAKTLLLKTFWKNIRNPTKTFSFMSQHAEASSDTSDRRILSSKLTSEKLCQT